MKSLFFFLLVFMAVEATCQLPPSPDSMILLSLNNRIDRLVVQQNVIPLDSLYANDFVFSHGSGRIEGKESWLKSVARNKYVIRSHDSVRVQQHHSVAVLRGKMYIERIDKDKTAKYRLRYIRVFAWRNYWQLISHTTIEETHL